MRSRNLAEMTVVEENDADSGAAAAYQRLLVVRCQLGERAALEELVRRWERPLLFYIRRLLPAEQDALVVLQDVWVKVFSGLGKLRDPERLAAWLYTMTRHTVADHLRDRYARRQLLSTDAGESVAEAPEPEAGDGLGWFLAAEEVHYGLSRVNIVDREVLTLYFLQDLSVGDIAEVLGIPAGTVKSRLHQARNNLRRVLCEKGARP